MCSFQFLNCLPFQAFFSGGVSPFSFPLHIFFLMFQVHSFVNRVSSICSFHLRASFYVSARWLSWKENPAKGRRFEPRRKDWNLQWCHVTSLRASDPKRRWDSNGGETIQTPSDVVLRQEEHPVLTQKHQSRTPNLRAKARKLTKKKENKNNISDGRQRNSRNTSGKFYWKFMTGLKIFPYDE